MLMNLNVIKLICDLIAYETRLAIKEEALLVAIAMLLGGNNDSQLRFNAYIREDSQNAFMQSVKQMEKDAVEVIKLT